ncbi:MAG: CoA transferase [Chloroflexota bacterium]
MPETALGDLVVLDLSQLIAGPYCTRLVAGMGAEVIKVEKPGVGDLARRMGPFPGDIPHAERSGLFLYLNAGKKSVTLNLKTKAGTDILRKLLGDADVLVESFAPRVMPSLGLDYNALARINPGLVMVSISNFGRTGPYRDFKAADIVEYALGGLMYITGEAEREPLKNGGNLAQYGAGQNAFVAALSALHYREETGLGQHVDVSIMECITSILEMADIMWAYQQEVYPRTGDGLRGAWGTYPCRDGFVGVISGPPRRWAAVSKLMDNPALADPRFSDSSGITAHRDEVDALMLPWLVQHDKEEVYHAAQKMGLPFGYVATTEDLLESAQFRERAFFTEVDHPEAGNLDYPTGPARMSETPWRTGRAPLLGEHNEEVYCGRLGYSRQDLVRLRQTGVI